MFKDDVNPDPIQTLKDLAPEVRDCKLKGTMEKIRFQKMELVDQHYWYFTDKEKSQMKL